MIDCCLRREEKRPLPWWKEMWHDIRFYFWPKIIWPIRKIILRRKSKQFASYILPVIKNFVPSNVDLNEIMKVQPMNIPTASVFYMDFVYAKPRWWQYWKKSKVKAK